MYHFLLPPLKKSTQSINFHSDLQKHVGSSEELENILRSLTKSRKTLLDQLESVERKKF
jgi:hypothetical protein